MERKKIGKLTCDYAGIGSSRICYLLVPLALDGRRIEQWAVQYGYNMVVIHGMDWDNDLTPWTAPGILPEDADFRGAAGEFLTLLHSNVIPEMERRIGIGSPEFPTERTLIGVSLSGLFALWAWMNCDDFTNIGSISGSFWYDGFPEWLSRRETVHKPGYAYFSLGDLEGKAGNPRFSTVRTDTVQVVDTLCRAGIRTMFEQTSGTHFAPIYPRLEKLYHGFVKLSGNKDAKS